ncbi:MAG TPA: SDR family NAD(P)-dependent oxidoreductase [Thermoanaerobaculia bacterium]|nr:SDR family NAD(P)-dependent oxidoreductase [Thermoanaerobaculia bacterium]
MKTLIITGGTGGLGTTVVARLERDYRCVLLRHEQTDLHDAASVRAALAQIDEPYGLVHLAGGYAGGSVSETSDDTWQQMIGLNLTASFNVIRETLARMRRDRPGRIVAISSEATRTKLAGSAAYTISKTGLNTLIELTAAELASTSITANALLPGSLDTPAMRKFMPDAKLVPLDRVAESIAFLLSDAASSINGALIPLQP